jgi:hypothetical protein
MVGQHRSGGKLRRADQPGFVGVTADWEQLQRRPLTCQQNLGAAHRQLSDLARAQSSSDDDALGTAPTFEPKEAPHHGGQFMGKLLDGGMNEARSDRVVAGQELVEGGL